MEPRHRRRPGKARRPRQVLAALGVLAGLLAAAPNITAQHPATPGTRLSTADRLRMLYAPQLNFTSRGDPIIRLGLLHPFNNSSAMS